MLNFQYNLYFFVIDVIQNQTTEGAIYCFDVMYTSPSNNWFPAFEVYPGIPTDTVGQLRDLLITAIFRFEFKLVKLLYHSKWDGVNAATLSKYWPTTEQTYWRTCRK